MIPFKPYWSGEDYREVLETRFRERPIRQRPGKHESEAIVMPGKSQCEDFLCPPLSARWDETMARWLG